MGFEQLCNRGLFCVNAFLHGVHVCTCVCVCVFVCVSVVFRHACVCVCTHPATETAHSFIKKVWSNKATPANVPTSLARQHTVYPSASLSQVGIHGEERRKEKTTKEKEEDNKGKRRSNSQEQLYNKQNSVIHLEQNSVTRQFNMTVCFGKYISSPASNASWSAANGEPLLSVSSQRGTPTEGQQPMGNPYWGSAANEEPLLRANGQYHLYGTPFEGHHPMENPFLRAISQWKTTGGQQPMGNPYWGSAANGDFLCTVSGH